jgi:hypothetical protein
VTELPPREVLNLLPLVGWALAVLVMVTAAILGAFWRGFTWLDARMAAKIDTWFHSDVFDARVKAIIKDELRYQGERLGKVEDGLAEMRGRMRAGRAGDDTTP